MIAFCRTCLEQDLSIFQVMTGEDRQQAEPSINRLMRKLVGLHWVFLQPWYQGENSCGQWPKQDTDMQLKNRFAPLLQDPDSLKKCSSPSTRERYETKSYSKRSQPTIGPQTLIVCDRAVWGAMRFCSEKNTKAKFYQRHGVWFLKENHEGALDVNNQRYWNRILLISWAKCDAWMLWCIWVDLCQQYEGMSVSADCWCWTDG